MSILACIFPFFLPAAWNRNEIVKTPTAILDHKATHSWQQRKKNEETWVPDDAIKLLDQPHNVYLQISL